MTPDVRRSAERLGRLPPRRGPKDGSPDIASGRRWPGSCPCCGAAAQPIGADLVVVGHGVVERQVLGPRPPGEAPAQVVVQLRRYRCRACRAVLVVGPRGLARRRWYGAGAIALALSMYARGATSAAVRDWTSPSRVLGTSSSERWVTLSRWVESARRGALFGVSGVGGPTRSRSSSGRSTT